jgi:transcriptional regulator with XRE-family HTH domain
VKVNPSTLKDLRELNGFRLTDLATESGVAISYLHALENPPKSGLRNVSPEVVARIAGALKVRIPTLVIAPEETFVPGAAQAVG